MTSTHVIPTDRLCLVVGVTGHRDVAKEDEAALRTAFAGVLAELAQACPHTPLLVLSGLAAGADSLAAEEAVARDIPVIACLPMPVEEYEHDFSPADISRFRTLLAASSRVTIVSPQREKGYTQTGSFIAHYSHLLVAFWDGEDSRGEGGTADVVRMRMAPQSRPLNDVTNIPYLPDLGPVYQIVTPRSNGTRPADACTMKRLYPQRYPHDESVERDFESILAHIDLYNVDLSRVPPKEGPVGLEAVMDRTDAAANRLQRLTNSFQMLLLVTAFAAATIQIMAHLPEILKLVGLAAAFVAYGLARKNDYENRYQDYRALAEGLRVQRAWYAAGLRRQLVDKAYLRMQEGELQWIRLALRAFFLLCCEDHVSAPQDRSVYETWVDAQSAYYRDRSSRLRANKRWLDRIGLSALGLGVASTILAAIALGERGELLCALFGTCTPPASTALTNLLTVPVAVAVILETLFSEYNDRQNLEGNARRYERMYRIFANARQQLREIDQGRHGDPEEIVLTLGRAALVEHADWLIMRRDRPIRAVLV
ncbi:MAG TPA: DUF4231 domain-containing protein [Candidatus Tyrphobacter sp.]